MSVVQIRPRAPLMGFKIIGLLCSVLPEVKNGQREIGKWSLTGPAIFCHWKTNLPSLKANVCPTEGQDFCFSHGCLNGNVSDRPEIPNH